MGFDIELMRRLVAQHGRVARVVVADLRGSGPREIGAAMVVCPTESHGTIGGGALEHEAIELAHNCSAPRLVKRALGPDLGQCCGGAVTLLIEPWDAQKLGVITGPWVARPVGPQGEIPFNLRRILAAARAQGDPVQPRLVDGWMIEPVERRDRLIWVWGAGHVGRAIVGVLAPLPGLSVTWVDTSETRFPATIPDGVSHLAAADPAVLAAHAPSGAEHLILTYSHPIDLALCDALLRRGFASAGLIGSASKWARFRNRLRAMGHTDDQILRISCPIGDPALGKHPQAIAVGVATQILKKAAKQSTRHEKRAQRGQT